MNSLSGACPNKGLIVSLNISIPAFKTNNETIVPMIPSNGKSVHKLKHKEISVANV